MKIKNVRLLYGVCFAVFLIMEVLIALFVHDNFVRPYTGDVLVVVVLYFFVKMIKPLDIVWLPLYIFLFAAIVEVLQLFKIAERLCLKNNTFARIIIGSVFDKKDILCYGLGCILIAIGAEVVRRKCRKYKKYNK